MIDSLESALKDAKLKRNPMPSEHDPLGAGEELIARDTIDKSKHIIEETLNISGDMQFRLKYRDNQNRWRYLAGRPSKMDVTAFLDPSPHSGTVWSLREKNADLKELFLLGTNYRLNGRTHQNNRDITLVQKVEPGTSWTLRQSSCGVNERIFGVQDESAWIRIVDLNKIELIVNSNHATCIKFEVVR
ncbi:MAG: hypothetical protein IPL46_01885 [Saprospiraceae bacterium]|nr:hypothetical protein [Saprospiraceae bacterium]